MGTTLKTLFEPLSKPATQMAYLEKNYMAHNESLSQLEAIGVQVDPIIRSFLLQQMTSIVASESKNNMLMGIPMYTNAAGVIPIVEALLGKGAALGTVLAFMMSVIALSLPEMIILRQVLTMRLIAVFIGVVASGILAVGFLFNILF